MAGYSPEIAMSYAVCATMAVASAKPCASSRGKHLRSVLAERSRTMVQISSCGSPIDASDFTSARCSSVGLNLGRGIESHLRFAGGAALGSDLIECAPFVFKDGCFSGELL